MVVVETDPHQYHLKVKVVENGGSARSSMVDVRLYHTVYPTVPLYPKVLDRNLSNFRFWSANGRGGVLFLRSFCDCSRDVAMVTIFRRIRENRYIPILILHTGIPRQIGEKQC